MADGSGFLPFERELVVDLFAGGGGASLGLGRAYREPDIAINHSPVAISVHQANHPNTTHYTCDVFEVDPVEATKGRPVGVLWASPDCRHHSKAAGGRPRSKRVRSLAWVVVKWAAAVKPRVILLENVEEFQDWGPLDKGGKPCPARKGMTFQNWAARLRNLGYKIEWRELVAADYGAPTIRKRLYVIARKDGRPIVWPKPSHARHQWRAAAECIDWGIPAQSIFERTRPLVDNTCRRIARGAWRYVLNTADPFIVDGVAPYLTEHANGSGQRIFSAQDPLRTQVAQVKGGHFAKVGAHLVQIGYGERKGQAPRSLDASEPLGTVVASAIKHAAVCSFFEQANGGFYDGDGRDARQPLSTVMTGGSNQRLITAYFVKYYGNEREGVSLRDPVHTVTTKDRMGLVQCTQIPADALTPEQQAKAKRCADFLHQYLPEHFPEPFDAVLVGDLVLVDFTLRMLTPRELARAQGFPDSYVLERGAAGEAITKTDQVRLIGNSVCPDVAEALARANLADLIAQYALEAA